MTHAMTVLILQMAMIVVFSRIAGFVFSQYLRAPRVLGELASGMLIGPFALGSIHIPFLHGPLFPPVAGTIPVSPELYGFAMVASIVLLFVSGLETDLPTFIRFSGKGSIVGLGGVVVSFVFGNLLAVLLLPGVDSVLNPTALFLGTLSTATSVGITARILSERRKMSSPEGVTILAAAVLDDVLGIILLAVVVGVSKVSLAGGSVPWRHIGFIAAKAFGFWIVCTIIGIILAPRITRGLKHFRSMETLTGISFGIALLLAGLSEMAGLAMIIGAYVTGLSLSQTDVAHEIRDRLEGMYQFFVPVFFCVMGMMVDFSALRGVLLFGMIYTAAAMAGKIFGCGIPALFAGFNLRGAIRIGAGMLPRGEVTLIVAGIGLSSGAIGPDMFGVAILTLLAASILAPPVLVKSFDGGSGYRKKIGERQPTGRMASIELEFPRRELTDFIRGQVLNAFRNEEFFVQHIDFSRPIYHIRKEKILITLVQKEQTLSVSTAEENELFVRLLILEEILGFKDFLSGLESMKSPDMMGAELMKGIFAEEGLYRDGK